MSELASQGYEIVRGILAPEEIASMRMAVTEAMDRAARAMRTPFSVSCPGAACEDRLGRIARREPAYAMALFRAVMADAHLDCRIDAVSRHPRLTPVVSALLEPLTRTGHVVRTRAVVHPFESSAHRWHQDVVRPSDDGAACGSVRFACWMPLSDVAEATGALELIPACREPLPHISDTEGRFFISDDRVPAIDRLTVPLRSRDVLIIDRFTPHRSLLPQRPQARWAVAMWVKAGARRVTGAL